MPIALRARRALRVTVMDVAYIVRPGNENEELRYSLRSLVNVPHGDVWIFGHRPKWVSDAVRHVFLPQRDPMRFKYENATELMRMLALGGPERFALMNDDFFCVRPAESWPRPAHRGSLLALADERVGNYGKMLRATASLLLESGIAEPLAYTLHKPLAMTRTNLQMAFQYGDTHRAAGEHVSWRSVYGNLMRLGGQREEDVKVHADGGMPAGSWCSTNDGSFRYHPVGKRIRSVFSQPSPYELT